ncbi:MAG: ABC transporter permease [Caldilineae bacterium]|nr:MAG: ABC transporter permease [Caldilineae bacterium]
MLRQITNLAWKELLQLRRDRFLILFLILAPSLQLILISRNTAQGLKDLPVAVLDQSRTAISREIVHALDNTRELKIAYYPDNRRQLNDLLLSGDAKVAVVIPPDFSRSFFRTTETAQIQALADGTNILIGSNAGAVVEGVIGQVVKRHFGTRVSASLGGIQVETSALFNPAINYQWFAIPSTLAFITYQVALVIAATGFVREKELGTMEQLIITPIRKFELILGKALPAILLGIFNFLLLMAVQTYGYGIPLRGDFSLLLGIAVIFVTAIVAQGTVISVLTQSQQQAVLLVFLFAIFEVTISGYLVPLENMPLIMRALAEISALQHFMTVMRAVALRGADLSMIWQHVLAIVAFGAGMLLVAWNRLTRTV